MIKDRLQKPLSFSVVPHHCPLLSSAPPYSHRSGSICFHVFTFSWSIRLSRWVWQQNTIICVLMTVTNWPYFVATSLKTGLFRSKQKLKFQIFLHLKTIFDHEKMQTWNCSFTICQTGKHIFLSHLESCFEYIQSICSYMLLCFCWWGWAGIEWQRGPRWRGDTLPVIRGAAPRSPCGETPLPVGDILPISPSDSWDTATHILGGSENWDVDGA